MVTLYLSVVELQLANVTSLVSDLDQLKSRADTKLTFRQCLEIFVPIFQVPEAVTTVIATKF